MSRMNSIEEIGWVLGIGTLLAIGVIIGVVFTMVITSPSVNFKDNAIYLSLQDATVQNTLNTISDSAGVEIAIKTNVHGVVTVKHDNSTPEQILIDVLGQKNLCYRPMKDNLILVQPGKMSDKGRCITH